MDRNMLLSLPLTAAFYTLLVFGLYRLASRIAATSQTTADKHLPYTGGEDPTPVPSRQAYQRFFKLALLFSILHVAALVLSTLPGDGAPRRTAFIYLIGIGISVVVLIERER